MKKLRILLVVISWLLIEVPVHANVKYQDTYLSEEIQKDCTEIGYALGVSPELLMAIIERESAGEPSATNGSCKGLMQINDTIHKERMERLDVDDIYDVYDNILVGTDYITELSEQEEDIYLVLMLYSMNHKTARRMYQAGRYTKYAVEVVNRSEELERAHGK